MPFHKLRLFYGGFQPPPSYAKKETEKEADKVKYHKTYYHKYRKNMHFLFSRKGHFSTTLSTMHTAKGIVTELCNVTLRMDF